MNRPLVSVVLASYNRCATLHRVLTAYERQAPAQLPFELVVVDDGSRDGSRELLAGWRPRRYAYRFAWQDNSGPAAARNRALSLARGEIVLFTGDDVEPAPNLLEEHWHGHLAKASPEAVILGWIGWPPGAELTTTMRHIDGPGAQQFSFHFFEDGAEYDFRHFYTSNVSITRQLLDREPSYFSSDFPAAAFEDAELAYRLARHGARIYYRAAARAYHHHRYTARGFFRRQTRCGEMAAVLYRKWPELEKWTGLQEIDELRVETLADPLLARRAARLAPALDAWERRAVHLAELFDPLSPSGDRGENTLPEPATDSLLLALFQYAFLRGLAHAMHAETTAQRLCATLYLSTIPQAVACFADAMERAGRPYPRADVRAILGLDAEGATRRPAGGLVSRFVSV